LDINKVNAFKEGEVNPTFSTEQSAEEKKNAGYFIIFLILSSFFSF